MALVKTKSRPTRLFKMSDAKLSELDKAEFSNEYRLRKLTEGNIGTLFPGLTFVNSEFRDLNDGEYRPRPDTLAFDDENKTFVVIEYKNRLNVGVIDQTKAYLNTMKQNEPALIMGYVNSRGGGDTTRKSYHFDAMYAIILAPAFTQRQIVSTDYDKELELYEIQRYKDDIFTMRRVGGGHERPNVPKRVSAPRLKNMDGYAGLPDLKYVKGTSPTGLAYPDDGAVSVEKWAHILAKVADWLVRKGHIDASHCPVKTGPENALLNTKPMHQNGKKFSRYTRVGDLYVFHGFNTKCIIRHTINLVKTAGLDPSEFRVALAPN